MFGREKKRVLKVVAFLVIGIFMLSNISIAGMASTSQLKPTAASLTVAKKTMGSALKTTKDGGSQVDPEIKAVILKRGKGLEYYLPMMIQRIAINNGTAHGNNYDKDGNLIKTQMNLAMTEAITKALAPWGIRIVQHGVTGTPIENLPALRAVGVRSAHVGTNWQNIIWETLVAEAKEKPVIKDLVNRMIDATIAKTKDVEKKYKVKARTDEEKASLYVAGKDKNLDKLLGKEFKNILGDFYNELMVLSGDVKDKIDQATEVSALDHMKGFGSDGTGYLVNSYLSSLGVIRPGDYSSLPGYYIFKATETTDKTIMCANIRNPLSLPGIVRAAKKLNAVIIFQQAMSELDYTWPGGYSLDNVDKLAQNIKDACKKEGFKDFAIKGDHITVKVDDAFLKDAAAQELLAKAFENILSLENIKDREEAFTQLMKEESFDLIKKNNPNVANALKSINKAFNLVKKEVASDYTVFALDASFMPMRLNVLVSAFLAGFIPETAGLEAEVGEIGGDENSTVADALEFITGIRYKEEILKDRQGTKYSQLVGAKRIGILTSGGPASGHNNAIYAAKVAADALGIELIAIWEGWKGLVKDDLVAKARALTLAEVEGQKLQGGTLLLTSRENPYSDENKAKGVPQKVWENIQKLDLDGLITLGGDDTNSVSYKLQNEHPDFRIIGGAKTMDNDIALPKPSAPNYGHDTFVLSSINRIKDALVDYKSTKRIGVIEIFGRKAGYVAARVGAGVNAARSLIPEEKIDLEQLVKDVKAYQKKNGFGVVIVSEGVSIEKPKTEKRMVSGPDGSLKEEEVIVETDPRIRRNAEILKEALAKDDRATAAYQGKNVKKDDFGNPKLEDAAAIISAVLKWGGLSTSLTGKLDYVVRSVPSSELDMKITSLIGKAAVEKIANGENNQLVYVDNPDMETMQVESMQFIAKLGGRTMDITEGGQDWAIYKQGNQALGMGKDGGVAAVSPQQSFTDVVELYKTMRQAEWFEKVQQPEFILLTPEQMQAVIWNLGAFQDTETWMWIRRIVRKVSAEQVAELKSMAEVKGLGKAMDLALKDINMFVVGGNALIFRAGAFNMFLENMEAGVNIVGIKSMQSDEKGFSAKDLVNHNTYLNKIFNRYRIWGMRTYPDQIVDIGGLKTPELQIAPDKNLYRPLLKIPYFEHIAKEEREKGKTPYTADQILDAYEKAGIRIDVMAYYGPDTKGKQAPVVLPYAKRGIPIVFASPVDKEGVSKMYDSLGKDGKKVLKEVLYATNRNSITADTEADDSLTCTSNAMLNPIMALAVDPRIKIRAFKGKTWHSATSSNSIFSQPSGRARQLIDWLRGVSVLDNFIPAGTGAAKNLQVVIDSLLAGGYSEGTMEERLKDLASKASISAVRTGTFAGSDFELTFALDEDITQEEVADILRKFARERSDGMVRYYEGVKGESDTPLDLNKIVGEPYVSIIDGLQIEVINKRMIVITGYYDNQYAAPGQMLIRHGARMVDARRAKEAIALRGAAAIKVDGGTSLKAWTLDANMYNEMSTGFGNFINSLKGLQLITKTGLGLIVDARTVIKNAATATVLSKIKLANPNIKIVLWAKNQIEADQLEAMDLNEIASIELKELAQIMAKLNEEGIPNERIVLINTSDIIRALSVAESTMLQEKQVKVVRLGVASIPDSSVNSMPLVVAKAVASVMPQEESVVKEYKKLTQSYRDTNKISDDDLAALNDLTASISDMPKIKVSEAVAKLQVAYEQTVSMI